MKAFPCIAISLIRNLPISRGVPVPQAGTSGHDVDYMKPRRVLCDVLSHSCVRHLSRHHCARNGEIALTNYCGAHVRNGVIHVIPAIPACPVRPKSPSFLSTRPTARPKNKSLEGKNSLKSMLNSVDQSPKTGSVPLAN